jgi:Matrixin
VTGRAWVCWTAGLVLIATPVHAYLKFGVTVDGERRALTWRETPVRYYVNDGAAAGVGAGDLEAAVGRAFGTWEAVPTATIRYQFAGFTSARPGEDDGRSTIGFLDRPDLSTVLAATSLLVDEVTGDLLESDIFFNTSFDWTVAPGGEAGRFDLESVALHEVGHFSGLGHSALGETEVRPGGGRAVLAAEAVMFPIAFAAGDTSGRALKADDVAGISDLYPTAAFTRDTGSVSGSVVEDGTGLFGAHVVAFDVTSGTLVGGFTLDERGRFSIGGLSPGPHVLRVEPLDDADPDSFFDAAGINVDFRVRYAPRLLVVPPGGDSGPTKVEVVSK